MINSRNVDDLDPRVAKRCFDFIAACHEHDVDIIITSTYRDKDSQDALYAQGRTKPGKIVTNARGGQSFHNYRLAFDFCPIVAGKAQWDDIELFQKCGSIGELLGLEYAGNWKSFKEYAHLQWTGGLSLADLQAGKRP
jgi:peptidoglycan L-alanyl-D-glutamate endopeptidase CwlK